MGVPLDGRARAKALGSSCGRLPFRSTVLADSSAKDKLISYRVGISQSKILSTLRSAMRKLGAQTRAQLVEKLRAFPVTGE